MPLQRRKSKQTNRRTLGGAKLQELRKAAGLSLLDLAGKLEGDREASIDAAHINKIETGSITKPQAETLETILTSLNANYGDRRVVLEAFGYRLPMVLPAPDEIEDVRKLTVNELTDSTYPILLIDFGHRLLAWNRYAPRLIGLHPDDPEVETYIGVTTFDLVFDPTLKGRLLVENPEEFWPTWLHLVKSGLYLFRDEQWYRELFQKARSLPGFRAVWDTLPEAPVRLTRSLSIVPLKLNVPRVGVLQFRLSPSDFLLDTRFQFIHFTPFGALTLRACAIWAEEEGIF
jgi:transcriptional regulator with XRE-family HTH domain